MFATIGLSADRMSAEMSQCQIICRFFAQRWFYLDVLAGGVFAASQNVPGAPARARQCRPTGRRAQGIFGAEWPSTRPNGVVARAAGKTCCLTFLTRNCKPEPRMAQAH
jgi:hypothetical protein